MERLHDDDCALIICKVENSENPDVSFSLKHMDNILDLSASELHKLCDKKEAARKEIAKELNKVTQEKQLLEQEKEDLRQKLEQEKETIRRKLEQEKEESRRIQRNLEQKGYYRIKK